MTPLRTCHSLLLLEDRALLASPRGWRRQTTVIELVPPPKDGEPPPGFEQLLHQAFLSLAPSMSIEVILGGRWTYLDLLELPAPELQSNELDAALAACGALFRPGKHSELSFTTRTVPQHLVIGAMESDQRRAIIAAGARQRLLAIRPLLSWLSNGPHRFRSHRGWIAVCEPKEVLIGHLNCGHLNALRTSRQTAAHADLATLIRRHSAGIGQPLGDVEILSLADHEPCRPADWQHGWLTRRLAT